MNPEDQQAPPAAPASTPPASPAPAAPSPAVPSPTPLETPTPAAASSTPAKEGASKRPVWLWVLLGVAILAVGYFVFLRSNG